MTDKNDLLAALDAAAVKLGRSRTSAEEVPGGVQPVDNIGTSRTSRDVLATGSATGSGQPIDAIYRIESLPALPVDSQNHKLVCAHTPAHMARGRIVPGVPIGDPKPAGITGSAGSDNISSHLDGLVMGSAEGSAGSDNIFNTLPSPLLLPDGRWRHQFPAELIPGYMSDRAFELCIRARACGVVLVADGPTLIVVEPWLSELEPETLVGLRDCAGEIIAQLRGEHRARPA